MGGGSSIWFDPTRVDIEQLVRESQEDHERKSYEEQVNIHLKRLLSDYNDRDVEGIRQHLDTIKSALDKNIEGTVDLIFGGSVSKNTYVSGLSDIDMLVTLNDTSLANSSPEEVKAYFAEQLRKRLPGTSMEIGKLAVTVRFSSTGHEIQLLPSLKTKTGVKIPGPDGQEWSGVIKPIAFAKRLTAVNQSCNNKVIPIIKLFKGLNASLPQKVQLSGYHIESLAIKAFEGYDGRSVYKDMLQHFCRSATELVMNQIRDSTNQSIHVDDYLGDPNSLRRKQCSKSLERLSNRFNHADMLMRLDLWKGLFTDDE